MNAFEFGQMVKAALETYPSAANPATHPEYAPNTPPVLFKGQKAEANIPPQIFGGSIGPDGSDDLFNVFQRQQSGQGLNAFEMAAPARAQSKAFAQATGAPSAERNSRSKIFPDMPPNLPEGAARPPMAQPPRGLGAAARR
jgi:hypothetical protein